jgi:hypothetical protein
MSRDWKRYNGELVIRREILIYPETIAVTPNKQKKRRRPYIRKEVAGRRLFLKL